MHFLLPVIIFFFLSVTISLKYMQWAHVEQCNVIMSVSRLFLCLNVEIYKWGPFGCPQTQTWDDAKVRPSKKWQCHHCWWVHIRVLVFFNLRKFKCKCFSRILKMFDRPNADPDTLFKELRGSWTLQWTHESIWPWLQKGSWGWH